jgi:predicted DNA-binding protein (UPF0251 family)
MVVSEVGFQAQSFNIPQPRTQLNVRPSGFTGRRRLPVHIDWENLIATQLRYGISEYAAVLILGYSLSSFYRHKKLRAAGLEKPYQHPSSVEFFDIERLQKLTGWTERKCAIHLMVPMTTYYRHRKLRDAGIKLLASPGALTHRPEPVKERVTRYLHNKKFMRKRKCRNNPNPKIYSWKPVEIDWDELREMQRMSITWRSLHQCAVAMGISTTTFYRKLKEKGDPTLYDRARPTRKGKKGYDQIFP